MGHMFLSSFESQRDAEFPAYEIQGPFCKMSQKVQVEQYGIIETCLGYEWFHKHQSPLIRASRGLIFLKEMSVNELLKAGRCANKPRTFKCFQHMRSVGEAFPGKFLLTMFLSCLSRQAGHLYCKSSAQADV